MLSKTPTSKFILWAEFLLVFGGIPLLILSLKHRGLMIATLWVGALIVWSFLKWGYKRYHAEEWNWPGFKAGIKPVLLRFAILAPIIAALTWLIIPESFLSIPRERPDLWLRIMLLYPLLSVWPQEIIYRTFIYHRYAPLWGQARGYIAASTISFGFMHIMFLNPVAVIMTALGGFLFASDFTKHKSLGLACLEHALYGCLIFTVGLGRFFYSGAAWG